PQLLGTFRDGSTHGWKIAQIDHVPQRRHILAERVRVELPQLVAAPGHVIELARAVRQHPELEHRPWHERGQMLNRRSRVNRCRGRVGCHGLPGWWLKGQYRRAIRSRATNWG